LHLLIYFYIYYKDARVHCVVLKVRAMLINVDELFLFFNFLKSLKTFSPIN
jgi:hypothetical protein